MQASGLSDDLDWWVAQRSVRAPDPVAMRAVLARLQAWKAQHDADRARQPGPFLQMAWDGVFGDEAARVEAAISEIDRALEGRERP